MSSSAVVFPFFAVTKSLSYLDGDVCEVAGLDIHEGDGGGFRPDEDGVKVLGSRRLRLHVGVRPNAPARLKFHYYFEGSGEVRSPKIGG